MTTGNILFVDLDGTLINSDLLLESLLTLIGRNPLYLLAIPVWLLRGKAHLKREIARRVALRVDLLPYNKPFLDFLREEKTRGRRLVLISASDGRLVKQVADHLDLFEAAVGSEPALNLKGRSKLAAIESMAGSSPFDYAGNERADLVIWARAANAILVNASPALQHTARARGNVATSFDPPAAGSGAWLQALRLHQWLKNSLLFLPLILSHQVRDTELLLLCTTAFLSFGLCASSVYLLNDLLDLDADRQHGSKQVRPFAAGTLSAGQGLLAAAVLLLLSALVATRLPGSFAMVLGAYYCLTLLYSFWLKQVVMIDVLVLATLYTLRIIAGAAAISVVPTFWLLAFSMFLFMSLAMVKRYTELLVLRSTSIAQAPGRGYVAGDLEILSMLGTASGFMAVLVFALYINADDTRQLYGTPEILWLICPLLLYQISRFWLLAHRGQLHDDPVVFAITDRRSLAVVTLAGLLVWAAARSWF
ncbi:MAG: hypothetical protein RLZZ385_863 [Pseudomonadota bacterium]|jgi:4-hydroxybenzoate polyprenyltransferase/phosphoserine phosphatase